MSFVDGLPDCEFIDFLSTKLSLEDYERPDTGHWSRVGSTIGALALKLNLMTETDVDKVLEMQDVEGGYFGELAVRAGFLSNTHVSALLDIQHMHDQLQLGEQLVVTGRIDLSTLIRSLSEFQMTKTDYEPHS